MIRAGAVSGLASVGLAAGGVLLPGASPSSENGASPAAITAFFEVHHAAVESGTYFLALSTVALMVFLAGLRLTLVDSREGAEPLATLAYGAGLAGATLQLAGLAAWMGLAERAGGPLDLATATAMSDIGSQVAGFSWFAFAVTFAVTAYLTIMSRAMPAWIGWISAGLVPLALVSAPIAGSAIEGVTTIAMLVWMAAIAVIQLRPPSRSRQPASGPRAT
ncbi:MAG: hypothetical protein ACTHNU_00695 [Gaiellales bacterium]